MKKVYSFEFNGSQISEESYGHGRDDDFSERTYLEDLWDLTNTYVGKKTSNILEWGSGISTLMFADFLQNRPGGKIITLDDNADYQKAVLKSIHNKNQVEAFSADLIGPRESQSDICLNYSTLPLHFSGQFDLIYLDGRRRVECSLIAGICSHENTIVVLHDYRRTRYQPMLALFDVLVDGPHFRVMQLKPKIFEIFREERETILYSTKTLDAIAFSSHTGSFWILNN